MEGNMPKTINDLIEDKLGEAGNLSQNVSQILDNMGAPTIYSLSQELLGHVNELSILEKKIDKANDLLAKINNQDLILKFLIGKNRFEEQKTNLTTLIKKLEYITDSIKDFTLFFIFIRRFHTLAIQKQNFEHQGKNISAKLIGNLKSEEESLYNEYVEGDCFSKVLVALSFETYQCYFKEYAKKFFENIQHSSDPYVNSLLILKAIFYECTYFSPDNFNLTDLKFFLSKNIPANVALPESNYELAALRCFFFYELVFEFLKLKTVKNNLEPLKKSVNLELNIVNHKSNIKQTLIYGLNDLQEALDKIVKKYNDFLGRKSEEKEADVNKALLFYNKVENEIQTVNRKTNNLINNKYMNLTKMRRMLAIIVNEAHLPKFLEIFHAKIGNDFTLNNMKRSELIETNQEALNHLLHAICRDQFYTPLNTRINSFINEMTENYSKDDISVLDSIELEDLIEFSFYYVFTLLYTDFNATLKGFNSKLLYTELVTLSVFNNIKLKALQVLEERKNQEINKFLEKTFKNQEEYTLHKKNILEEIKLSLEVVQDTRRILFDTKSLENSLAPRLESSQVPMPEKNLLLNSIKCLEKKQKICELEYQKIEKHKFINKPAPAKLSKTNQSHPKKNTEIECNKAVEYCYESLNCLSENLSESLKLIKEKTLDITRVRQKISSAIGQISSSMQKLLSSINGWKNPNETPDLSGLSLPKLLELVGEIVIKKTLNVRQDHQKKFIQLQELITNSSLSIELLIGQVNLIVNKYHNYNNEAKKILNMLSASFIENYSQFFHKSLPKKVKRQISGKLPNDYMLLKEQSNWLEKIIRLIKCDTDERVIKLYTVIVEADDYQKTYELLNEKINFLKRHPDKKFNKLKSPFLPITENPDGDGKETNLPHSNQLMKMAEEVTSDNLSDSQIENIIPVIVSENADNEKNQPDFNQEAEVKQEQIIVEEKLKAESISIEVAQKNPSNNSNAASKTLLEDYENWSIDFDQWKNENHTKLYELFHIIETCSKSILNNSDKAFLECLSLYQKELSAKNDELRKKKYLINPYLEGSNQALLSYFAKYQKWFDEIFRRIILCRTLILQNENDPVVQESPRLTSALADNRAEFNSLLTFYLGATDKYNKFRDDLISEEDKLNNLNRNFIKQILRLGSLDETDNKNCVLSDFSKQLDRVNQLKLAIEQEFETKQKIKEKLSLLASPEVVNFYLSRIDPYDAEGLKVAENYLPSIQATTTTNCVAPTLAQECNICTPAAFYYLPPSMPIVYPNDGAQPCHQIYYSM